MDAGMENSIRQEQIESFGRLMAGLAHDMKNHLGIIRESNGLMDDILAMGASGEDAKMVERLQKSIAAIERRVVLSAKMMHHLSGLAHRTDSPLSSFLVNELIEEEYTFLERFSRLKQIGITFELRDLLPAVYNDPSLLQHIFYRVYATCLDLLENQQKMTIATVQEGKNVVIVLTLPEGVPATDCEVFQEKKLLAAIDKINGQLKVVEQGHMEVRLTVASLPLGEQTSFNK